MVWALKAPLLTLKQVLSADDVMYLVKTYANPDIIFVPMLQDRLPRTARLPKVSWIRNQHRTRQRSYQQGITIRLWWPTLDHGGDLLFGHGGVYYPYYSNYQAPFIWACLFILTLVFICGKVICFSKRGVNLTHFTKRKTYRPFFLYKTVYAPSFTMRPRPFTKQY
ncbi:hypothetical protein O3M35_006853 [Rhynocoris fuscipes]|uniref:Uncharacterized protein n=1 Tax=Rhynocoris fuscipes TaxID=488301 RepID=A0AAW1DML1_9HEMI